MEKSLITVPIEEESIDLIPRYLENRWADVRTLEGALEGGDLGTFRTLGHSMKGSGGGYGLDQVTDSERWVRGRPTFPFAVATGRSSSAESAVLSLSYRG